MAEFVYMAPLVIGLGISLVELFFVHADERGLGWMSHGLHAIPVTILFTFISMNVPWVLTFDFMSWMPNWAATWAIPILIGLIAAFKVKAAAAIAKGGTVGESLPHALIIGALIAAAPFVWPLLAPSLPAWAQV
jgi:hypothetical protein